MLYELNQTSALGGSRTLYEVNRDVYGLLRYGVKVRPDVGAPHVTVWLIDWNIAQNNDFAIAEDVTVLGEHTKRPDIVLYVNGIALRNLDPGEVKRLCMVDGGHNGFTVFKPGVTTFEAAAEIAGRMSRA